MGQAASNIVCSESSHVFRTGGLACSTAILDRTPQKHAPGRGITSKWAVLWPKWPCPKVPFPLRAKRARKAQNRTGTVHSMSQLQEVACDIEGGHRYEDEVYLYGTDYDIAQYEDAKRGAYAAAAANAH